MGKVGSSYSDWENPSFCSEVPLVPSEGGFDRVSQCYSLFLPAALKLPSLLVKGDILSESALQGKTGDRSWYLYLLKGNSLWDLPSDSQDNGTCFVFCTNTCIAETTSIKSRVQRWCVVIAFCREVGRVASKFSGSQCQGKEQNLVSTSLLSYAWTSQCCVESSLKWDEIILFWQVPGNVGFK